MNSIIQQYKEGDTVTFVRKANQVAMLESPDVLSGSGIVVDVDYVFGDQKTKYIYFVELPGGRVVKVRDRDMSEININIDDMVAM